MNFVLIFSEYVKLVRYVSLACLVLCAGIVTGHAGNRGSVVSVYVYKADGSRQCEHSSLDTLASMREQLADAGINVFTSRKGWDGREGIALCGSPTGEINIYEIDAAALHKAMALGFRELPETR